MQKHIFFQRTITHIICIFVPNTIQNTMKSFAAASTLIVGVSSFSPEPHHFQQPQYLQMSTSADMEQVEKPIYDPMGLYPENSAEKKANAIVMVDDSMPTTVERKIRDPLGLYTENTQERQDGIVQGMESSVNYGKKVIYDPLGLYPQNSSEREEGLIEPLEVAPDMNGIVTDPLNIYEDKSEIDTNTEMSLSIPFLRRPKMLDGTLPGDRGFDPFNFASDVNRLEWYRSAEIRHSRLAMLVSLSIRSIS